MSDVLDRLKTAERTAAEKFTGGVAVVSRQIIVDAIDEIERLRAIVEGAKLSRNVWIVDWGWNGKETGYGYFIRLRHSTTSEWAGESIEDAWTAIYRKDMAFRSNYVLCAEVVE